MWFKKAKKTIIDLPKIQALKIFRDGYYAGNAQCRQHKDSLIMENIIKRDFEEYWNAYK